jgi:hypothetical protein
MESILSHFLKPRVAGTPEHAHAQQYIIQTLESLQWDVEIDVIELEKRSKVKGTSQAKQNVRYHIIATKKRGGNSASGEAAQERKKVVLATHFNTESVPGVADFEGATDAGVPCAILLEVAYGLNHILSSIRSDYDLQIIFLDGDISFEPKQKDGDSANNQYHETLLQHLSTSWTSKESGNIEVLIWLDMLGMSGLKFENYFPDSSSLYDEFFTLEQKLKERGVLQYDTKHGNGQYFVQRKESDASAHFDNPFEKSHIPTVGLIRKTSSVCFIFLLLTILFYE